MKITGIRTRHYESVADAGRNAAIKPTNHIKDGWIVLDDTTGIGLDFDVEALAPLLVDSPLPATFRQAARCSPVSTAVWSIGTHNVMKNSVVRLIRALYFSLDG